MNDIAIICGARKGSTRVPNKMLRPFGGSNLYDIYLSKLEQFKDIVYAAVREKEFIDICKRHGFRYILRDEKSINGETTQEIFSYLLEVSEEWLFFTNPCHPFVKTDTIDEVIKIIENNQGDNNFGGLISVCKYDNMVWNSEKQIMKSPCYISSDAFTVFKKSCFLDTGRYWNFTFRNPEFFIMDKFESFDINTPLDFMIAEELWNLRHSND